MILLNLILIKGKLPIKSLRNSVSPCVAVPRMQVLMMEIGCLANNFMKYDYFMESYFLSANNETTKLLKSSSPRIIHFIIGEWWNDVK